MENQEKKKHRMVFKPTTYILCNDIIKKFDRVCDSCGSDLKPVSVEGGYRPGCSHAEDWEFVAIIDTTNGVSRKNYEIAKALVLNQSWGFMIDYKDNKKSFDALFRERVYSNCRMLNEIEKLEDCGLRCTENEFREICKTYYNIN